MEITKTRKADVDQQEQPEKKSRGEQDQRGVKRSTDKREKHAEGLKAPAERRADENK